MTKFRFTKQIVFSVVGFVVIAVAFMVMCGWIFNIRSFTSVLPQFPTMKFNTALAFACSGWAMLLVFYAEKKVVKYLYCSLSSIIFIIGFATLLEHLLNINLGIDVLFFPDPPVANELTTPPGRMVVFSTIAFSLLGFAFMGIRSPVNRVRHWAQYALHAVSILAFISFMGYVFNLTPAYTISHYTSMAIHTSLLFVALSVTLSFYNSDYNIILPVRICSCSSTCQNTVAPGQWLLLPM